MESHTILLMLFPIIFLMAFSPLLFDVFAGGLPNNYLFAKNFCEERDYDGYILENNWREGSCYTENNDVISEQKFKCIMKERPYIAEIDNCYFVEVN